MKDNEKLYDGITGIRDDLVEGAEKQDLGRKRPRGRLWLGAAAAVLVLAMVGGYFMWPGGRAAVSAYAISEADYPEMAQYPNDMIDAYGMPDGDGFDAAYEAWQEGLYAQRSSARRATPPDWTPTSARARRSSLRGPAARTARIRR